MAEILAWGTNKFGQLGNFSRTDQLDPVSLEAFRGTKLIQVSAGPHHSLAVAELGDVYVWGRASEGQWGNGERRPVRRSEEGAPSSATESKEWLTRALATPAPIWALRSERIVQVETGNFHSLALAEDGRLYEFGRLYHYDTQTEGETDERFGGAISLPGAWARTMLEKSHRAYYSAGVDEEEIEESDQVTNFGAFKPFICPLPRLVPGLERIPIRTMAAGYSFNLAVTQDGRCFSWGYNERFQLGLGDRFNRAQPCRITFPQSEDGQEPKIVAVACGEQHSLFLSRNGSVYSCGLGVFGQLGHGVKRDERRPKAIASFANESPIVQISCGSHHSAAVDALGRAWLWGHAEYAQMAGTTDHQDWQSGQRGSGSAFTTPRMIAYFQTELDPPRQVRTITCGDLFTMVLTTRDEVFGWGWNSSGALGTGTRKFVQVPTQIVRLQGEKITHLSAGGVHSLAINGSGNSTFGFDFKDFVGSPSFADITFRVQNVPVHAHRIIIFLRCPALSAIIGMTERFCRKSPADQKSPEFPLPGVKVHVFRALLVYLYTDHLRCTPHWLEELREMAVSYRLPHLAYLCTKQLTKFEDMAAFELLPRPHSTFSQDLAEGINASQHSDIRLSVPKEVDDEHHHQQQQEITGAGPAKETFYAHRVLLAARCEYLRRIFEGPFQQDRLAPELEFQDLSPSSLKTLLHYIYAADESPLKDPEMLIPMLMISDRFILRDLKQVCEEQLERALSEENVGCLLILADRYNAPRLRRACLNFFKFTWSSLLGSPAITDLETTAPDLVDIVRHYVKFAPGPLVDPRAAASSSSSFD